MDTSSPPGHKKNPLTKARLGCGLTVIGIPLFLMFWWWRIGTVPETDIPMPRLPVPNAHDTYVAAGNALKDDKKIDFAIISDHTSGDVNDHPYTLAQKQALLDENSAVLAQIKAGLQQEYYAPPLRSAYALMAFYAKFRAVARLIRLKEQVQEAKGDWNASMASTLDAVQMGAQIPRGAVLIGELVGVAMQAIGRRPNVWAAVEHLNAAQIRSAITRLQLIRAQAVPLTDTMQEEEWFGQASLQEMFRQPNWMKGLSGSNNNDEGNSFQQWINQTRLMLYGKRGIMMNYTRYMDQIREVAKSRYGAHLKYPDVPNDPITSMILPTFDNNIGCRYAGNQAQNDMLLLALCLRAYRLEHGMYPHALTELSPAYLSQLPEDPFAAKGTYGYKRKGSAYGLYSVGPDGKDDGGVPIDDKTKITKRLPHSHSRYVVHVESKGDIVAGINP